MNRRRFPRPRGASGTGDDAGNPTAPEVDDAAVTADAAEGVASATPSDPWVGRINDLTRMGALVVMVGLLELLPVQAWLMTLAAFQTGDTRQTAAPFWLLALTLAAFALGGRLTAQRGAAQPLGAGIVVGALALTVALLLPSSSFLADAPNDKVAVFVRLAALVAYLGWRGLGAGAATPFHAAFERFQRLFTYGMVALLATITISVAAPTAARAPLIGALGLFLPVEIFAGLLALAISKAAFQRLNARGAEPALSDEARWLGMAVGLAALVVVAALVISVFVSFPSVSLALAQFGPLGVLVNDALTWIISAFVYLLYLIFNPLLTGLKSKHLPFTIPTLPQTPCVQRKPGIPPHLGPGQYYCPTQRIPTVPAILTSILIGVAITIIVLIISMILFLLIRDLARRGLRRLRRAEVTDTDEEREDLDARGLLGEQLRELLGALGRPRARPAEEPLPQGSVRWLYREALRASAARGLARAPGETPDEFAARLAPALSALAPDDRADPPDASARDFTNLSEAYNRARYDDHAPTGPAPTPLRDRATHLIHRLRSDGKRR